MYPTVRIFSRQVPTYWLCAMAGILVCSLVLIARHNKFKELQEVDITNSAALSLIGAVIGGRVLSVLTLLPLIIRGWSLVKNAPSLLYDLLSNGQVFYGGLFGALLVLFLYARRCRLDRRLLWDYVVPVIPLFHAFGRVGCFLTGCCHGKISTRFGVVYTHSISGPNGVPLFPIQLVFSLTDLALCAALFLYERRHHRQGGSLRVYLLLYAVCRFVLEFFRGDEIRGIVLGLSVSQWISLAVLLYLLIGRLRRAAPAKATSPSERSKRNASKE